MGTITPTRGINNGYFYSSEKNDFWELVDYVLEQAGFPHPFNALKTKLNHAPETNKQDIRNEFHNNFTLTNDKNKTIKIAVCDILKSCFSAKPESALDKNISNTGYQFNWSDPLESDKSLKFILANSYTAIRYCVEAGLIIENNHDGSYKCDNGITLFYVPSPSKRSTKPLCAKKAEWNTVFSKVIKFLP
jgi:hypothetical protein